MNNSFSIEWFLKAYFDLHNKYFSDESDDLKNKFRECYNKYDYNYEIFLFEFGIPLEQRLHYLSYEKYCIFCRLKYPIDTDCFLYFYKDGKEITNDICHCCISSILKKECFKCKEELGQGPYEAIYVKENNYFCKVCNKVCNKNNYDF